MGWSHMAALDVRLILVTTVGKKLRAWWTPRLVHASTIGPTRLRDTSH
ncbi:MAG: hypothetical protein ABL993_02530 [Vicinamibacterales bacterium]